MCIQAYKVLEKISLLTDSFVDADVPRTVGQLVNWLKTKTVYEASISKCAKCVTSFDKVSNIASDLKQNRFVHTFLQSDSLASLAW